MLKLRNKVPCDEDAARSKRKLGNILFYGTIAAIVLIVVLFKVFFSPVTVVGDSMYPTYRSGDMLLSGRISGQSTLSIDSIVVFHNDDSGSYQYIKRIVGVPGDTLQIIKGDLYRNGMLVEDDFEQIADPGILEVAVTLGENQYFVMGDNRNKSNDSRSFGPIYLEDIDRVVLTNLSRRK